MLRLKYFTHVFILIKRRAVKVSDTLLQTGRGKITYTEFVVCPYILIPLFGSGNISQSGLHDDGSGLRLNEGSDIKF